MKKCISGWFAVLAVVAAQTGVAAVQVAGQLLVDVAASDMASVGNGNGVASWQNKGTLGGTFDNWGGCPGATYYSNVRGAQALWFDGTTNTVLVSSITTGTPPELSGGNNTWSAEFWILCPSINLLNGDFMSWTRRPASGGGNMMMEFRYGTDGNVIEHWTGNFGWGPLKPPHALWHHVVVTRDSDKVQRVYVNGLLYNTATLASLNVGTNGRMVFGATMNAADENFQFPYYGYIGQARVHTGVLSLVEVEENYATELPLYTHTPYPDGTALVDVTASDLSSLADGASVLTWPDNGMLASSFDSPAGASGPKFYSDVQGVPAVLFDTTGANVLVGASVPAELTASPTYTVEAWLNTPELRSAESVFLSWTPQGTTTRTLMEFRYFNSYILCEHYNAYTRWPNDTPPVADTWHHIATTRDGASGTTLIYINGQPASLQVVANPHLTVRSDGAFVLGGTANNDPRTGGFVANRGYNGYMGALRVSAGVKSAAAILATYNAEAPSYGFTPTIDGDGVWVNPDGGDWSEGTNWNPQAHVNGAGKTANFLFGGGAVTNDLLDLTLSEMLLGWPGTDISGNLITFADGSAIKTFSKMNTVSAPLALEGTFFAAPSSGGSALTLSGNISGIGPLVNMGGTTVLSGNNTFTGGTINQLGTLEVNDLAVLGTGPLTLGDGTFRYTGASTTYAPSLRTEAVNRPATIEVTQPDTTLTLSGKFDGNAPFAKRGPGTLALTYAGDQQLNTGLTSTYPTYIYNTDGVLQALTFGGFAVSEGTLILDTPGKTNTIANSGHAIYVGTHNTTSATLRVNAGTLQALGGWLSLNRGTGTPAVPGKAAVYVSGADTRVQLAAGLVMANADGMTGHNGSGLLDIDQSTFVVGGNAYIGESGNATSTVNVKNGATFEVNIAGNNIGLSISQAADSKATFTADGSTVRTYSLMVNRNGTLDVKNGTRFESDLTSSSAFVHNHATYNKGTVTFDNATFAQRTLNGIGLWLHDMPSLFVGNGGLTLETSGWVSLDPVLARAPGAAAAAVTKTGPGTIIIRPTAFDVNVADGTLALCNNSAASLVNPPPASALTMDGGSLAPTTDGAFFNKTAYPSDTGSLVLSPPGTLRFWDAWQVNGGGAFVRNDGWIRFANGTGSQANSIFLREKQRVTGPWTATFTFIGTGIVADGFAFVIHNDARGSSALGASGSSVGYMGAVTNSIGVIFDVYNGSATSPGRIRYARSVDTTVSVRSEVRTLSVFSLKDSTVKTYITLSYDGVGTLSGTLRRADGKREEFSIPDVDILDQVGGDMAYIGFTGGTGGSVIQQGYVGDVTWDDGVTSALHQEVCQYNGNIALGNGTLNALLNNFTPWQSVSVFDTLTFGDNATLNVDATVYPRTDVFPALLPNLLANTSAWKLNGEAAWLPNGSICVSSTIAPPNLGTFFSTSMYDVASAWTAKFTYQMGAATATPADFVSFTLQNVSPNEQIPNSGTYLVPQGLSIRWDYYQNGANTRLVAYLGNGTTPSPMLTSMGDVTLRNRELTYMTLTYDPAVGALTVLTEQPGIGASHTHTFTGIGLSTIMSASDGKAYIGFTARSGGSAAEDIISSVGFVNGISTPAGAAEDAALAFRHYDGAGTINHEGTAALALLSDVDIAPPADVTLRLNGGGLNLRRVSDDPLGFVANRGEWVTVQTNSPSFWTPNWASNGDAMITTNTLGYIAAGFVATRRINVARDFTANFTYVSTNAVADGFCLVFHNDPRGQAAIGGAGGQTGYLAGTAANPAIQRSFALRFNIWNGNQIGIGKNGAWAGGLANTINLKASPVGIETSYDASAKTFTATLTNAAGDTQTHTFTDVDLAAQTESDYANVLIVGTTGGSFANQAIRNFSLTYPELVTATDEHLAVGGTEIPAGASQTFTLDVPTISNPMFLIENGTFGNGSALRLVSKTGGTLRYADTTLDGAVAFDIQTGVTLNLQNITSGAYTLTKCGGGDLTLNGAGKDATLNLDGGNTDLSALATGSGTQVNLSGGATVTAVPKRIIGGGTLDGTKLPAGIYRPGNCDWVTAGQVNIGSIGTIILLK